MQIDILETVQNQVDTLRQLYPLSKEIKNQQLLLERISKIRDRPEFSSICLYILGDRSITDSDEKLFFALLLKNFIIDATNSPAGVSFSSKFKNCLIESYFEASEKISLYLLDIISRISYQEFPYNWPSFFEAFLSNINAENIQTLKRSFILLEKIIEKYELSDPSDELFKEINLVTSVVCEPILKFVSERLVSMVGDTFLLYKNCLPSLIRTLKHLFFHDIPQSFFNNISVVFDLILKVFSFLISTDKDELINFCDIIESFSDFTKFLLTKYEEDLANFDLLIEYIFLLLPKIPGRQEMEVSSSNLILVFNDIIRKRGMMMDSNNVLLFVKDVIYPGIVPSDETIQFALEDPVSYVRSNFETKSASISRSEASLQLLESFIVMSREDIKSIVLEAFERLAFNTTAERIAVIRLTPVVMGICQNLDQINAHLQKQISCDFGDGPAAPFLFTEYMVLFIRLSKSMNMHNFNQYFTLLLKGLSSDSSLTSTFSAYALVSILSEDDRIYKPLKAKIEFIIDLSIKRTYQTREAENEFFSFLFGSCLKFIKDNSYSLNQSIFQNLLSYLEVYLEESVKPHSALYIHSLSLSVASLLVILKEYNYPIDKIFVNIVGVIPEVQSDYLGYIFQFLIYILLNCRLTEISEIDPAAFLNEKFLGISSLSEWVCSFLAAMIPLKRQLFYSDYQFSKSFKNILLTLISSTKTIKSASILTCSFISNSNKTEEYLDLVIASLSVFQKIKIEKAAHLVMHVISCISYEKKISLFELLGSIQKNLGVMVLKSIFYEYLGFIIDLQELKFAIIGYLEMLINFFTSLQPDLLSNFFSLLFTLVLGRNLSVFAPEFSYNIKSLYDKSECLICIKSYPHIPNSILSKSQVEIFKFIINELEKKGYTERLMELLKENNHLIYDEIISFSGKLIN